MSGPAPVLAAEGVGVVRGGRALLDDVSVAVSPGELLVLAGPNGAGKSTLLSVLAGDDAPDRGRVLLGGADLCGAPPRGLARRRAVMLQEGRVAFSFRVHEVVTMGRAPWAGHPGSDDDERAVAAALVAADVDALADRLHPTLSGGERARTAFARLLAQACPVLLLDEPTAALDIAHQERLLGTARDLAAGGAAVVVVLHDLSLTAAYAHRVALLDAGRLAAVGTPAEVLTGERLSAVYRHPVEVLPHPTSGELLVLPRRAPIPSTPTLMEARA